MIWSSKDKYFVLFKLIILQNTFRKNPIKQKTGAVFIAAPV
jgi:hypothetical protein